MRQANKRLKVFSGNANRELALDICRYLGLELGMSEMTRFKDGEIRCRIGETVRGSEVFIVQPLNSPSADNIMELLIMIDAMKRASAKVVCPVIPYFAYARQDRKSQPRDPISAKLLANLLAAAGADRVVTLDLHAGQIQGFFDIPVDNLKGMPIIAEYLVQKRLKDVIVVSPDVGGVVRSRELADRLHCQLAIVDKRRPAPNLAQVMNIIGEVEGKTAVLVDDMIDTGGTIVNAAKALLEKGATEVYACSTHAVFSDPAVEILESSPLKEVIVTDSIHLPPEKRFSKLTVLSVAPLLAEAIRRIFEEIPVSMLFD
ncbi:MAG TPA: ribose-phosphate pyrophosphokinase [Limnochordia bacterium]|jgi:ribose-phosphate pyrophosphokinase|nr:ribose-phosphate pyrophosphokinase [Bacillota bacterium]HKM43512.1 ribose-phosphate pyrophosphokinase [Limnochordia bacterium]